MGLAKAISNFFKSIKALFTGKVDAASASLNSNPTVIKAKYDEIIREKMKGVQQYKKAVAALVAQEEKKIQQVKKLSAEVERLERLKTGAASKAKQVVAKLKAAGKSSDNIHADSDYRRCLSAFNDFSSTLKEKQEHIADLEGDIQEYHNTISDHKTQLQGLMRSIDELKSEASETVADVLTAKEEKEISDLISGISIKGHNEELQKLRELRGKAKAEARIAKEITGLDSASEEREFLDFAMEEESTDEFDALIGLDDDPVAETAPETFDTRLPE